VRCISRRWSGLRRRYASLGAGVARTPAAAQRPHVMPLQPSRDLVLMKLRDCFPDARSSEDARAVLDTYGTKSWHRERDRVQLAILMQSCGDLKRLRQLAEVADRDYRDALVGAEYPQEFQASSKTSPQEMGAIRARDRQQYEAWLQSGGAQPSSAVDRASG
jgi:hypothetical protein